MHAWWQAIFGNSASVEVEIGSGTGSFLLPAAQRHPQTNFVGIEHSHSRGERLETAVASLGLRNVRIIIADGACTVAHLIPVNSVAAYHVYFPDPWWKRRHQRRRLFTPEFVAALERTLIPGGRLFVATDVDEVFTLMRRSIAAVPGLVADQHHRSPRSMRTVFERKGIAQGATIREATFYKPTPWPHYTSRAAPITPAESPS